MKRLSFLLTFLVLSTFSLHAQDAYEGAKVSRVTFLAGVKLGVNLSQLNGDNWEGGYKAGLLGGLYAGVKGKHLGIQIEGLFNQSTYITGNTFYDAYSAYYNDIQDSLKQGRFRVNYLSIPVLVTANIFRRVTLQLGPQYSGIVSVNDGEELLKDAKGLFETGSVDGVCGLWLNITSHLNVGARYVISLTSVNNEEAISDKWNAKSLQLHVGYTF